VIRILLLLVLALPIAANAAGVRRESGLRIGVPAETLVDQDGNRVSIPELFADRTVVVSFAFTTCTTICSPMTAVLGKLQGELGERLGTDVRLVTISLDPRTDTPERLAEYADKFGRREGWSFLTGPTDVVRRVLRPLGGYVAVKEDHAPVVLVGNAAAGKWVRVHGLASSGSLLEAIDEVAPQQAAAPQLDEAARNWFTDTVLVDQHGKPHRFYSDLVRGKKVMINFAFASCETACSPITANLAQVQRRLGDRVGRDVRMITITVDPARDTPERLRTFAEKFHAGPGWYFLSGAREDVESVLRKLGGYTETPADHSTAVLIGDATSGTWAKGLGMSPPEQLAAAIEGIDD
jgi:protein SCO1